MTRRLLSESRIYADFTDDADFGDSSDDCRPQ